MKNLTVRIEATCPEVFEIVDRAESLGIKGTTALPFRPGTPGATGTIYLREWVNHDHPCQLSDKMLTALGTTPHRGGHPYFS